MRPYSRRWPRPRPSSREPASSASLLRPRRAQLAGAVEEEHLRGRAVRTPVPLPTGPTKRRLGQRALAGDLMQGGWLGCTRGGSGNDNLCVVRSVQGGRSSSEAQRGTSGCQDKLRTCVLGTWTTRVRRARRQRSIWCGDAAHLASLEDRPAAVALSPACLPATWNLGDLVPVLLAIENRPPRCVRSGRRHGSCMLARASSLAPRPRHIMHPFGARSEITWLPPCTERPRQVSSAARSS
mmetsp:Transcript_29015/g.78046  ORF Transcript_29015/g.78046 Transcript_29015/m.78046 type:complete len:239 (+) Transcript_29015:251-967(+)